MMKKLMIVHFMTFALVLLSCSSDDDNKLAEQVGECEVATEQVTTAQANYKSASEENYTEACNAYKTALQAKMDICGDEDGSLQAIIDVLGDCTQGTGSEMEDVISVTTGTLSIEFDKVSVIVEDGLIKVTGETSTQNDYAIYFEVGQGAEGEGVFQNFEITTTSTFYPYTDSEQYSFYNEVSVNEGNELQGTFSGYVQNNNNGMVGLSNGSFYVEY